MKKGYQTPRRRTVLLIRLAHWATHSPRSSQLGELANEGQLRAAVYRGQSGVAGDRPRYAPTSRDAARDRRRRAHRRRLQNITLRSTTVAFNEAGLVMPPLETPARSHRSEHRHQLDHRKRMGDRDALAFDGRKRTSARLARRDLSTLAGDVANADLFVRMSKLLDLSAVRRLPKLVRRGA